MLFVVIAVGYLVGKIRIGSFSLGVSAVLFAGLGISAWYPDAALPQVVYLLGLVLFVYTIGLASGPGFFGALRKKGLRDNLFALGVLLAAGALVIVAARLFGVRAPMAAGLYAGSLTNTPALAGVLESLHNTSLAPVVGYSLTYPLGVLGVLATIAVFERVWKVGAESRPGTADAGGPGDPGGAVAGGNTGPGPVGDGAAAGDSLPNAPILAWTIRVTRRDAPVATAVAAATGADVELSRISDGERVRLIRPEDRLTRNALVTVVGEPTSLRKASEWLGERVTRGELDLDRRYVDSRRVFVSNPDLAGRHINELNLRTGYGVIVTRIRRGDVDMVAHAGSVLEPGDRVRIVGARDSLDAATRYFGDSYRRASELDVLTFAIGIGLGLLVGLIPVPLPGGSVFHLGAAGGALLVALVLGAIGRSGPVVWQLGFSANMALRQIGAVLFLAGIGTQAGGSLGKALGDPSSMLVIGIGAGVTVFVAATTLVIGHRVLGIPFGRLTGVLASVQTQPAVLAFANEHYPDESPNVGYASVYPVAMITKIMFAQLLLVLLS